MSTIATSISAAKNAQGEFRAGGTDLMDRLRHHVSTTEVVDISRIPGLGQIVVNGDGTCGIGALVTIDQVAHNEGIRKNYPGLAQAAGALANPQIRRAASMGGALLQRSRCWYYRHEDFSCYKKGGNSCPMREGNHQYGVCFDLGPCVAPHPSTLGMALMAYDAEITVDGQGRRTVAALYGDGRQAAGDHLLAANEVLTHLHLPAPIPGELASYFRSISRARAEWPLVETLVVGNASDVGTIANARVVIGGVANVPLRLKEVENYLNGRSARRAIYEAAGRIAIKGVNPLIGTQYKVELVEKAVAETVEQTFASLETED
ncbi:MAG TPA: FAD binding domain-containing protein [Bacteroidia bacterium]|nr:FAD binding domain-containing protein [Bacteroidia bacterium]